MEKHNHLGYGLHGSAAEDPTSCFFTNSNSWDFNPMDQNDPFESALSSMVSSPAASSGGGGGGGGGGENVMLRELIGRLGSVCNSGEISPHSYNNIGGNTSTNTTCYSTPLNSPPKVNLTVMDHQMRGKLPFSGSLLSAKPNLISPFPPDPGFAERAARYSSFAKKDLGCLNGQIGMSDADFGQGLIPKLDSGNIYGGASSSNWSKNVSGSQMAVQVKDNSMKSGVLVSDKKVSKLWKSCTLENSGFGDSMEISSLTEHVTGGQNITNVLKEGNPRKRKSSTKGKDKEPSSSSKDANLVQVASEKTDTDAKRSKSEEDNVEEKDGTKIKEESNSSNGSKKSRGYGKKKQDKDDNTKDKDNTEDKVAEEEPPKDYIHVRARRGQATDAHSLAERVRREKISERMKLLQNLVPGCNLVTGKAVLLDEIINYVQSLQHQVEFLSMKLATINPRSEDLNVEPHLSKDVISYQGLLHHNIYPSNASAPEFSLPFHHPQGPIMQNTMRNGIEVHHAINNLNGSTSHNTTIQMPSSDNFGEVPSQVPAFWGNDLHTVVQMGLGQNQTQNFHGIMSTTQMKIEQ